MAINKLYVRDAYIQIKMARLILTRAIDQLGDLDCEDPEFGLMQDQVIEASDKVLQSIETRLSAISWAKE